MPTALLLEDNETDAYIARRALSRWGGLDLVIAADLDAARAYLEAVRCGERPPVAAVFADLRLPRGSGFDLVEWARGIPELADIRFVLLTNYPDPETVRRAYALGVSSVIPKGELFADDGKLGEIVSHYWLDTNRARGL
ncbi:MAG TPA: hypothetical protein VNT60_08900 [Deinococcales bacterium]|nr:hypothetical protein [Deinococcales bacterium]